MSEIRLQKVMAAAGVASRRGAERLIQAGRVAVNGQVVTELGTRVDPERDRVTLDGRDLRMASQMVYLALHKPRAVLTASQDGRGRRTVMDLLGEMGAARGEQRVFHVGRLDYHSEGLLLLTNDGELAMTLTHPSSQVPKVYHARVRGLPDASTMKRLRTGVDLEDGPAAAVEVELLRKNPRSTWIALTVVEGRNRLIRRMLQAVGHPVSRLVRMAYGGVELGDLPVGAVRALNEAELAVLRGWQRTTPSDQRPGRRR